MLAAYLCREVADHLALGRRENRDTSISRLGLEQRTRDEQDRALDVDDEYQKQKILRGMLTLFAEFVGFVLFRSLEERFHTSVGAMLENGSLADAALRLDFGPLSVRHRKRTFGKDDLAIILYSAFEHCIGQL